MSMKTKEHTLDVRGQARG
jgi:hypothetical protein